MNRRPGFLVYGLLAAFVIGSALPLYWSVRHRLAHEGRGQPDPAAADARAATSSTTPAGCSTPPTSGRRCSTACSSPRACALSVAFVSTLAGYAFAKLRFRGSKVLMGFVVMTMAVPTQLAIVPLFILMRDYGLLDTLVAVALPTLVTAFGVFFMRQYLVDAVPDELIEAARMDGCTMIRTFWTVAVPAARPAMAILFLFTFMMVWTDYMWPLVALQKTETLQIALDRLALTGQGQTTDYALVLAGAGMATIPLLILFALSGRQLVAGIMQGAVKG